MSEGLNNEKLVIELSGRVDTNNAPEVEKMLFDKYAGNEGKEVVIDAAGLNYISSSGLRSILRFRKTVGDITIINVNSDVYEIFEMTGFTEMMTVEKAYRVISVEGCEVIGEGANGKVYRVDEDNVVKTYKNADALKDIKNEREMARLALILGIPTAISYDVVKVGDSYGSVFEMLRSRSFSKILNEEPDKYDWCVKEYVGVLKKFRSTSVPAGKLPSIKVPAKRWVEGASKMLTEAQAAKLAALVDGVEDKDTMIHGDFHTRNIVLAGDEVLVIDMDTLATGNPIFELAQIYNCYVGFSEYDKTIVEKFMGLHRTLSAKFWKDVLKAYFDTDDEKILRENEDKIRVVAYSRLIYRKLRHPEPERGDDEQTLELWRSELVELLEKYDDINLVFTAGNPGASAANHDLDIEAATENLPKVLDFVDSYLEAVNCSPKVQMQIDIAVEEIFVNIANYAYSPEIGRANVRVEVTEHPLSVSITFMDNGKPYDPLAKEDPDITLSADQREIGGLGIFMTKKTMDSVEYEYKNGSNILTLKKNLD